jgi:hypothetical protein
MHRITRSLFAGLLVAAGLWPVAGAAYAVDNTPTGSTPAQSTPTGPVLTVDQVRDIYVGAGYKVDPSYSWDWTSPPVTTFQVNDLNGRILLVLVYPTATAAVDGRLQAESHELALNAGASITSAAGPHLVVGYGPSVWNGNVALVQTSQAQLDRVYQAQVDRDSGVYAAPSPVAEDPGLPNVAVDLDFLQALQNGAANL